MARSAVFVVRLDKPALTRGTVRYATQDGTAIAATDYTAVSGTLQFDPGETVRQIAVPIRDISYGPEDKSFSILLSHPHNVTLADASATAIIPGALPLAQPIVRVNGPVALTEPSLDFSRVGNSQYDMDGWV